MMVRHCSSSQPKIWSLLAEANASPFPISPPSPPTPTSFSKPGISNLDRKFHNHADCFFQGNSYRQLISSSASVIKSAQLANYCAHANNPSVLAYEGVNLAMVLKTDESKNQHQKFRSPYRNYLFAHKSVGFPILENQLNPNTILQ